MNTTVKMYISRLTLVVVRIEGKLLHKAPCSAAYLVVRLGECLNGLEADQVPMNPQCSRVCQHIAYESNKDSLVRAWSAIHVHVHRGPVPV